ncbi:Rho GTPase [Pelomyxa schiedti]|nr:Rho GTPase [Pelomyxa schiedti]
MQSVRRKRILIDNREISDTPFSSDLNGYREPLLMNCKCVVIGDSVGSKTDLLVSYVDGGLRTECPTTVFDNTTKTVAVDGRCIDLTLWDTSGLEDAPNVRVLAYARNTSVFIVVFSVGHRQSFESVSRVFHPEITKHSPETPYILVGTRTELGARRLITYEQGVAKAKEINAAKYMECSAVTHEGVREVFEEAARCAKAYEQECRIKQLEEEVSALKKELTASLNEVSTITERNQTLNAEVEHLKEGNMNLEARFSALTDEIQKQQKQVEQMISLIPADVSDFTLEKLLGTGASAAAFKVRFSNSPYPGSTTTTSKSTMVMKVLFNWESTPRHTRLRQKYMAECVILSSIPPHPNIIHPLGALVIPRLSDEFIEQIPVTQLAFREMALNKSLALIMPFGGIPLSAFLQSLLHSPSSRPPWDATLNLFLQAVKAVHHLENSKVVHRDIKEDNLLVDPETHKLSLIDFGEATQCRKADLEVTVAADMQLWGNTGTMPPELSSLLRTLRATGPTPFSYSKCDSFAVAVTLWDALLPPDNKFIGSTLNNNMAAFTPVKLSSMLPDPLEFFPPCQGTHSRLATMKEVMIAMMAPEKHARMSCSEAIQCLSSY